MSEIYYICVAGWHTCALPLQYKIKKKYSIMNTQTCISALSSLISSKDSYNTLVELIGDMDLEFIDAVIA